MRSVLVVATLGLVACASSGGGDPRDDTGLDGLAVLSVGPQTLVPGSRVVVSGRSFVGDEYGRTWLRLAGTFDGAPVDVTLDASFVDYDELLVDWAGGAAAALPGESGTFSGDVTVEVDSTVDGERHASPRLAVTLEIQPTLEPRVDLLQTGVIFVNDPIVVEGGGFLLGGDEGTTFAVVEGCFTLDGQTGCDPVGPVEVAAAPESAFDRTRVTFPFDPVIAGIRPGRFDGTVTVKNVHGDLAGAAVRESPPEVATYDIVPPTVFSVAPTVASLGQFVDIRGGGFVGLPPDSPDQTSLLTTLELVGTFTPEGGSTGMAVSVTLVPEFVSGPLCRYVLSEEDDLGMRIDLRTAAGTFQGTIRPIIQSGPVETVIGDATPVTLGIGHVKQVVWVSFLPSYVESLRHFGLRAMDMRIRERVLAVAQRDFEGVNVEFRDEEPTDFAYYTQVDISGPDPNGLGLLGYDNSPGKDQGNQRLYDRIGGVNATTQEDGYPGYGGVFVESFFGFSEHPGDFAQKLDGSDPMFDTLFDPFRADQDGRPVLAADLGAGVPNLTSGDGCPAADGDRSMQIACAVWVLGSMIGTTMTHEVGHSLGLANPMEELSFHNMGDEPNRLMDAGGARTFYERAELMGQGPAVFCTEEYTYLRAILPTSLPSPGVTRPSCY